MNALTAKINVNAINYNRQGITLKKISADLFYLNWKTKLGIFSKRKLSLNMKKRNPMRGPHNRQRCYTIHSMKRTKQRRRRYSYSSYDLYSQLITKIPNMKISPLIVSHLGPWETVNARFRFFEGTIFSPKVKKCALAGRKILPNRTTEPITMHIENLFVWLALFYYCLSSRVRYTQPGALYLFLIETKCSSQTNNFLTRGTKSVQRNRKPIWQGLFA